MPGVSLPPAQPVADATMKLEGRLARIEAELHSRKEHGKETLKALALIFSVFGAAVAIPRGWIDISNAIYRQPKTSVIADNPLNVSYERQGKMIRFESLVILKNDGNTADAIKRAVAHVVDQNTAGSDPNTVLAEDIQFSEGASVVEAPIVQPGTPVPLTISLSLNASPETAVKLLSGAHRLNVKLNSLAKDKDINFCFTFEPNEATEIVNAKPIRLLTPACDLGP